jgi:hypothetical protein
VVTPAVPAQVPARLDTLDGLAAGRLLRFEPKMRDACARDVRSWLARCDELRVTHCPPGITRRRPQPPAY